MRGEWDETGTVIGVLNRALDRVDESRLDATGREALRTARAAVRVLGRSLGAEEAEPLVDRQRYRRLIEIAGPEGTQELLERLGEDLRQVERGLTRALGAGPSLTDVRAQTHVLVSLAGAVGAVSLQRLAEALNAAAHEAAADGTALAEIERLGAVTLQRLTLLSQFIAAEEAAGPTAA